MFLVERKRFKAFCILLFLSSVALSYYLSLIAPSDLDETLISVASGIIFISILLCGWRLLSTSQVDHPNADIVLARLPRIERIKTKVQCLILFLKSDYQRMVIIGVIVVILNLYMKQFLAPNLLIFKDYETYSLSWSENKCILTHQGEKIEFPSSDCELFQHNFWESFTRGTVLFSFIDLVLLFVLHPMQKDYSDFMRDRF